jgi:acyl carrier protein
MSENGIKTAAGRSFASMEDLERDLIGNIVRVCAWEGPVADIKADDILINGDGALQLDSMDAIEISMMVHQVYGVKIQDISSAKAIMATVSSLAAHIRAVSEAVTAS